LQAGDADEIARLRKADPHPALEVRGILPERNLDAFYAAFGAHSGDKMYLPSDKRVTIW
jgi:putative endopeptidase